MNPYKGIYQILCFLTSIVFVVSSACYSSVAEENARAWYQVFFGDPSQIPTEYTESLIDELNQWIETNCPYDVDSEVSGSETTTYCKDYSGNVIEVKASDLVVLGTLATPFPDEIVAIKWTWDIQRSTRVIKTVFIIATSAVVTTYFATQPQVVMARNPDIIVKPDFAPGVPQFIPEHILNHPRGAYTQKVKAAIWITVMNAFYGGQKPDWCGRRASDGAVAIFFKNLMVKTTTDTTHPYSGLAVMLNQGGTNSSTAFSRVTMNDGAAKPFSDNKHMPEQNDFWDFDAFPCPPPNGLTPLAQ